VLVILYYNKLLKCFKLKGILIIQLLRRIIVTKTLTNLIIR
jgi:hypothetical protein